MKTISKKSLVEYLKDERKAAKENAKESQKRTNIEYYNGIIDAMFRIEEFINKKY